MRKRGLMVIGILLIVLGLLALISNLTGINFSNFCFPAGLILIGIWVLVRPRMVRDNQVEFNLIGDYKREGAWAVQPSEIWSGIGTIKLDFNTADVPSGETFIHVYSLVGDVILRPGPAVGLALTANGLINSIKWMGAKQDNFLNSVQLTTADYARAERRVQIEVTTLVGDIKVVPPNAMG
jgi:predicted membrane protein